MNSEYKFFKKIKSSSSAGDELIGILDDIQNEKYSQFYFENKVDEIKKLKEIPKSAIEKIVFYCGASCGILNLFCKKIFSY